MASATFIALWDRPLTPRRSQGGTDPPSHCPGRPTPAGWRVPDSIPAPGDHKRRVSGLLERTGESLQTTGQWPAGMAGAWRPLSSSREPTGSRQDATGRVSGLWTVFAALALPGGLSEGAARHGRAWRLGGAFRRPSSPRQRRSASWRTHCVVPEPHRSIARPTGTRCVRRLLPAGGRVYLKAVAHMFRPTSK